MSNGIEKAVGSKSIHTHAERFSSFFKGSRTGTLLFVFVLTAFSLTILLPNRALLNWPTSKKRKIHLNGKLEVSEVKSNNDRIAELMKERENDILLDEYDSDYNSTTKTNPKEEKTIEFAAPIKPIHSEQQNPLKNATEEIYVLRNNSESRKSSKLLPTETTVSDNRSVSTKKAKNETEREESDEILPSTLVTPAVGMSAEKNDRNEDLIKGPLKNSQRNGTIEELKLKPSFEEEITTAQPNLEYYREKERHEDVIEGKNIDPIESKPDNQGEKAKPTTAFSLEGDLQESSSTYELKKPEADALHLYEDLEGHVIGCAIPNSCFSFSFSGEPRIHLSSRYTSLLVDIQKCVLNGPHHLTIIFEDAKEMNGISEESRNIDVIGFPIIIDWFSHFAHFLKMYEKFMASSMGIFYPGGAELKTGRCINPENKNDSSDDCIHENLQPDVVLSSSAMGPRTRPTWIEQLFEELQNATGNRKHLIMPELPTNGSKICFRHFLTSIKRYYTDDESLDWPIRKTGISRDPIQIEGECNPHIVLIVRPHWSGRAFETSVIAGIEQEIELKKQEGSQSMPTFETVVDIGKYSLREQMDIMQRADVIVLGHGAELSNSIFLRPNSTVIEVCPFLYRCEYFDGILSSAKARHVVETSFPDRETFEQCMIHTAQKNLGNKTDIEHTLQSFRERASKFEMLTTREEREAISNPERLSFEAQVCVRSQKLIVDPKSLVESALEEARSKCKNRNTEAN